MSTPENGGPAFPEVKTEMQYDKYVEQYFPCAYSAGGMTLRDWFAGQAINGMCACEEEKMCVQAGDIPVAAEKAYIIADAMLAARKKDL